MITSEDFSDPIRTLWTRSCGFVQPDLDNGQASIALSFWHQLQTDFPLTLTLVRPFWFHYFAPPLRNLNCANVVSMIGTSEAQPRVSHGRHVACRIASMPDDKGMEWEVDDHLPWHLSPCISQFCAWCWVRSWCWGDQRSTCCTIDVCLVRCCGEVDATYRRARPHLSSNLAWLSWRATAGLEYNQYSVDRDVGNIFQNYMCFCTCAKTCCSQSKTADTIIAFVMKTI